MKRGRDFQSLAQLVYCCDNYPEHSTPTAQKMEQWVSRAQAPSPAFKTAIGNVLTKFWYLADSPEYNQAFKNIHKRVAPIEFVFIGGSYSEPKLAMAEQGHRRCSSFRAARSR